MMCWLMASGQLLQYSLPVNRSVNDKHLENRLPSTTMHNGAWILACCRSGRSEGQSEVSS